MYLLNAFSLNVLDLPEGGTANITVREIDTTTARLFAIHGLQSAVGHATTAAIFEHELDIPIAHARASVKLQPGVPALIGQYIGPRLEEGATVLPPGATIKWFRVEVKSMFDQNGNGFPPDDDDAEIF